jgi:4-hydroxy-3-polyprenylbenzoate decarboxylase
MYRMQVIDRNHTAMHWHMHHDGARHWRAWKKLGKPMPCALVLGGESVLPYAATAPLPPGISELIMAGFLNDGGIELVPCKTIDMHVPANAEIVIEGHVSTEAGFIGYDPRRGEPVGPGAVFEGPFGDHTGFYSLPDRYPLFEVSAITHRKDPIYPTTIVGPPPQEDYYLGKATERIFLPLLQTMVHDIVDYDLPMFGAFHNCAFIKIHKEYPLQARRVMHAIWGAGQMAWTKMIVVVDEDVDVHDHEAVLFHLCANCDPGRDIEIVNGPLDILDHAAPRLGAGHKIGFDATRKIKGEECGGHTVRDFPTFLAMNDATRTLVERRMREYGLG